MDTTYYKKLTFHILQKINQMATYYKKLTFHKSKEMQRDHGMDEKVYDLH